jgi:hypothetical protein
MGEVRYPSSLTCGEDIKPCIRLPSPSIYPILETYRKLGVGVPYTQESNQSIPIMTVDLSEFGYEPLLNSGTISESPFEELQLVCSQNPRRQSTKSERRKGMKPRDVQYVGADANDHFRQRNSGPKALKYQYEAIPQIQSN